MENSLKAEPAQYGELIQRDDSLPVVSIILSSIPNTVRKDFHCLHCGRIVFNYYSDVRIIIQGEMRQVERPVDIMCSRDRCKFIYRIA